jgi:hypothetical protein
VRHQHLTQFDQLSSPNVRSSDRQPTFPDEKLIVWAAVAIAQRDL